MSEQAKDAPVTTQASEATANANPAAETKKAPEEKQPDAKAPPAAAATEEKKDPPKEAPAADKDKKTDETAPPAEKVVPEKYELKAPDGSLLKQPELEQIAALAKERGLTQDDAQKLVEERSQLKAGFLSEQKEEFSQLRSQWKDEFTKDPEFGGDKAKESAELAKRFVDRFADPELKKAFDDFGFGDHPKLIRLFARAGRAMAEDKHVRGGQPVAPDRVEAKDVLYGNQNKN